MLLLLHLGDVAAVVPCARFQGSFNSLLALIAPTSRTNHTFANYRCTFLWYKGFFMLIYGIQGSSNLLTELHLKVFLS